VQNKAFNDQVTARLATFMRNDLPPGAPVAVYSIGEVGFLSEHPIIDMGGITRPDVLPYLSDRPLSALPWAQSLGAQYFVGMKPQPKASLVYHEQVRFASWTLNPARYKGTDPLELWKLETPQQRLF
jgi:hypothetical protein